MRSYQQLTIAVTTVILKFSHDTVLDQFKFSSLYNAGTKMTQALSLLYSRSEPDAVKNNQWKDAEKILRGFSLQNICISDLHKTVYVYDKQGIDFKLRV